MIFFDGQGVLIKYLVPMRQLVEEAAKDNYALGINNVNNMKQISGSHGNCPREVIIQVLLGTLRSTKSQY